MSERARKFILLGATVTLAAVLLACFKPGGGSVITPVPPTPTPLLPTPTPPPPTPTPVPEARPEILAVTLCRGLTDDGRPFAETNTYSTIDPFAISIKVANLKPSNVIAARWYQQDAPIGLTERDNVSGNAYVGMSLEPQGKWIPGSYRVEVSLDGEVKETRDFEVIAAAALPLPGGGGGGGGGGEGGEEPATTTGWKVYRNANLGFSMTYPEGWAVEEGNTTVQFSHPRDSAIALVVVNSDPQATPEEEAQNIFNALSQKLPNLQMVASKAQEEGWHLISFTYNREGSDIIGIVVSKLAAGRGYSIVFLVVKDSWDALVPALDKMWNSFETTVPETETTTGVLIAGRFVDGDTGRGIQNALFVILKEGVTVKQFVDSGNDESLIYDMAQSGADGSFKMNIPVKRGSQYAVIAVAKGYKSITDVITVGQEVPDQVELTITMQKQ